MIWSFCGLLVLSQATLFSGKKKEATLKHSCIIAPEKIAGKLRRASRFNNAATIRQLAPSLIELTMILTGERARNLLHLAAANGSWHVVQSLLDRGMDPNAKDATGRTPLMHATENNNRFSAAILLSRGANPREMSPDGVTPLLLSPISPAFVRTFRKNLARKAEECSVCLEPKSPDDHRMTSIECLHTVCRECKDSMVNNRLFDCPLCREGMDGMDVW
jgi:hypothetical protein